MSAATETTTTTWKTPADISFGPKKSLAGRLSLRKRLAKLFTREDPVHLHKTLGFLSLCHYVYRYLYVYPRTGTLGLDEAGPAEFTGALLHVALSSSSLIFTVIKHRILEKPFVIYEEYRLHAIVFTLRGFDVLMFGYYCQRFWPVMPEFPRGTDLHWLVLFCIVMAHHVVTDYITVLYGDGKSTAVRSDGRSGPIFTKVLRFYSLYQFLALASHLTVNPRMMDSGWNPTIAVQSSAFCMTLYRKRLIRGRTHAFWYSACLLLSIFHIVRICEDGSAFFLFKVFVLFGARIHLGINKYVLWATYSFLSCPSVDAIVVGAIQQAWVSAVATLPLLSQLLQGGELVPKISTAALAAYCLLVTKPSRKTHAEPTANKAAEVATELADRDAKKVA